MNKLRILPLAFLLWPAFASAVCSLARESAPPRESYTDEAESKQSERRGLRHAGSHFGPVRRLQALACAEYGLRTPG